MQYGILERDFIERTLKILEQYDHFVMSAVPKDEQFEVTLLINCLLGLLVLPSERCYATIPTLPLSQLQAWGLPPGFIVNWSNSQEKGGVAQKITLPQIVQRMRNGAAHIRFQANDDGLEITDLEFTDRNGFHAVVPVTSLQAFVTKLAQAVKP